MWFFGGGMMIEMQEGRWGMGRWGDGEEREGRGERGEGIREWLPAASHGMVGGASAFFLGMAGRGVDSGPAGLDTHL